MGKIYKSLEIDVLCIYLMHKIFLSGLKELLDILLVLDLLVRQLFATGVIVRMEKELQNKLRKYFILQVIAIIVNFCISFQNSRQDSGDDVMT